MHFLGVILNVSATVYTDNNYELFKVIISGGGTGGHIYPAIAIAKEILIERKMLKFYLLEHMEEWKWKI